MSDYDQAREIDRRLNAARTFEEMRDAVHARRLVRAAMDFDHAMQQFEERNPVGPLRPSSFFVVR